VRTADPPSERNISSRKRVEVAGCRVDVKP